MNKYLRFTVVLVCLVSGLFFPGRFCLGRHWGKGLYVVYKAGIDPDAASVRLHQKYNAQVISHYQHALSGAFVRANDDQIQQIQADETVAFVELNQRWSIEAQTVGTGIQRSFAASNPNLSINGQHDYTVDADVAVIDTGIDLDHPDLNVVLAINCSLSGPSIQEATHSRASPRAGPASRRSQSCR